MFSAMHEVESFFDERKKLGIKPGLERIHKLLELLGHPEKKMRAIHVAGTNGKGSTIHFLKAALQASQYETGVFTSPSFSGLTGHIFLNDKQIKESEFISLMNDMYPHIKTLDEIDMAPTEFEILTVLSFLYFSNNGDIVLIETGMGGRFDTTNSFHPILSIITNVAIDHTDFLGKTDAEVAYHKAGIIKQSRPVILGPMKESALQVAVDEANKLQAPSYIYGKDFTIEKEEANSEKLQWQSGEHFVKIKLRMQGEHQSVNVSLVLKALEVLERQNFHIEWSEAITAIEKVQAPGRFELLNENPVVIADAAHNIDGVQAFVNTVNKQYPSVEKHVIAAMFKDKDTDDMLQLISRCFNEVTLTSFDHPRAASAQQLFEKTAGEHKKIDDDWKHAIGKALEENKFIFITGSLHFITMVRQYFQEKTNFM